MTGLDAARGLDGYPGRGLLVGRLTGGDPFLLYLVTGRSRDSLGRRAAFGPDDSIRIEPVHGPDDDALRHYTAVVRTPFGWLVGNGTHVEALASSVDTVDDLPCGLGAWEHEPDPPIWTPRIVAAVVPTARPRVLVGAARRAPGGGAEHAWLDVAVPDGAALRIQTYAGDPDEPRTAAVPIWVRTTGDLDSLATDVWTTLAPQRRVLLVARNLTTGHTVHLAR